VADRRARSIDVNRPHPVVFLFLIMPFGVMQGYLSVTLGYQLAKAGVSTGAIAALIALGYVPHTWKFLWAPIADTTLSRKLWYVLAAAVSAVGIFAMGALPANAASLPWLSAIVLLANLAVTFLAMAVESLMAYAAADSEKGRAGGWFQAGNLGGTGLGGGAGLWIAERVANPLVPGAALAAACVLCCVGLVFIREPPPMPRDTSYVRTLKGVVDDLWTVARSRPGFLALLICFLPIGSGAASNLFSATAGDWQASADAVALVNGIGGGMAAALGCIAGGYLCDRMDRKTAYYVYGIAGALCAVAMAAAPRTELAYSAFCLLYWFISGLAYAAFSAVVLEAIGLGAAATKYSLFASLSNMPIQYMTLVDGWAHTRWGTGGMLLIEALVGLAAVLVFLAVSMKVRKAP
jgi:MFS transporter, PAT family, beta-lactamase induction signal transducer AmpG